MGITFCEECRRDIDFFVESEIVKETLKGESYEYVREKAVCVICKNEVFVAALEDKNLNSLYDVYRITNDIISLENILELPEKYHIGKCQLSLLLGWGEMTFSRYCDGDIPTKLHSDTLRKMYDEPEYGNSLLNSRTELF